MSSAVRLAALLLAFGVLMFGAPAPHAQGNVETIAVGNNWFCDPQFQGGECNTIKVNVGDKVAWDFSSATVKHTTTECGASCPPDISHTPLWDSLAVQPNGTFQFTFDQPGIYRYYCTIHGATGPFGMAGVIEVNAPVGGIAEVLGGDGTPLEEPDSSGSNGGLLAGVAGAVTLGAIVLGGAAWYAQRRRLR